MQSLPSSTMRFIDSRCPLALARRFSTYVQSETERVSSILFHTFVSNYYSRGLFELLFQYFKNDLERDIHRNDSEQMKALMDTLATKSLLSEGDGESFTDQFMEKGSRAYKLKQHTLQAISANQSHSSMRLRRFIRMIDNAFWKDSVPKNPTSRLSVLFKEWISDSEAFKFEFYTQKNTHVLFYWRWTIFHKKTVRKSSYLSSWRFCGKRQMKTTRSQRPYYVINLFQWVSHVIRER